MLLRHHRKQYMRIGHYQKIDKYNDRYLLVDKLLNGWVRNQTDIYIINDCHVGDYKYSWIQFVLVACLCYFTMRFVCN